LPIPGVPSARAFLSIAHVASCIMPLTSMLKSYIKTHNYNHRKEPPPAPATQPYGARGTPALACHLPRVPPRLAPPAFCVFLACRSWLHSFSLSLLLIEVLFMAHGSFSFPFSLSVSCLISTSRFSVFLLHFPFPFLIFFRVIFLYLSDSPHLPCFSSCFPVSLFSFPQPRISHRTAVLLPSRALTSIDETWKPQYAGAGRKGFLLQSIDGRRGSRSVHRWSSRRSNDSHLVGRSVGRSVGWSAGRSVAGLSRWA
jgi:hypothetical protein